MAKYKTRNKWTYKLCYFSNRKLCIDFICQAIGLEIKASEILEEANRLCDKYENGGSVIDMSFDDTNDGPIGG